MTQFSELATAPNAGAPLVSALPATQFDSPGQGQCVLDIAGTISLGPSTGQSFQGTLTISIGQDGAIDTGSVQFQDGTASPVVGQVTGRSIRLRIGNDPDSVLTFVGSGVFPVDQCTGDLSGAFAGPGVENVGVWTASGSTGA